MDVLLVMGFELVFIIAALQSDSMHYLKAVVLVNMILIVTSTKVLTDYGIGIGTASNMFYATVIAATFCIYYRHGKQHARQMIRIVVFAVFSVVALRYLSLTFSHVPANETIQVVEAYLMLDTLWIVGAILVTFYLSMTIFIICLEKLPGSIIIRYSLAAFIAQAIGGALFSGVVFRVTKAENIVEFALVGLAVKTFFALLMVPVVWRLRRSRLKDFRDWYHKTEPDQVALEV